MVSLLGPVKLVSHFSRSSWPFLSFSEVSPTGQGALGPVSQIIVFRSSQPPKLKLDSVAMHLKSSIECVEVVESDNI